MRSHEIKLRYFTEWNQDDCLKEMAIGPWLTETEMR